MCACVCVRVDVGSVGGMCVCVCVHGGMGGWVGVRARTRLFGLMAVFTYLIVLSRS